MIPGSNCVTARTLRPPLVNYSLPLYAAALQSGGSAQTTPVSDSSSVTAPLVAAVAQLRQSHDDLATAVAAIRSASGQPDHAARAALIAADPAYAEFLKANKRKQLRAEIEPIVKELTRLALQQAGADFGPGFPPLRLGDS